MAETIDGGFVEQLRQLLPEPREIFLRRQRTRAIALSRMLEGIDQVDVGTEDSSPPPSLPMPNTTSRTGSPSSVRTYVAARDSSSSFQPDAGRYRRVAWRSRVARVVERRATSRAFGATETT